MWFLESRSGVRIYLKLNQTLTVGRKKADFILTNDDSISRLHSTITVEAKEEIRMPEPTSACKIKDAGSKYGTYAFEEDRQIEIGKEGYNLKHKDKIRFGLQEHIYVVNYIPIVTVISSLSEGDKRKLQNIMDEIDGLVITEWKNYCTHVTVAKATLTEKITCALASNLPIVNLSYWEAVKSAFENNNKIPDPNEYVPRMNETLIYKDAVSLCPNEKRRTLFKGLLFVHFTLKQYKIYGRMINMAGGESRLYSTKPIIKELCASNVVVLQYPTSDSQSTVGDISEYGSICNLLQENKRRLIPESEIPLAILFCSTTKYCNPKYQFGKILKRGDQTSAKSHTEPVLVQDTQDVLPAARPQIKIISDVRLKSCAGKAVYIPETLASQSVESFEDNSLIPATKILRFIPETCESYGNTSSIGDNNASNSKKQCVEKTPLPRAKSNYIPETNDSFSDPSGSTDNDVPINTNCATIRSSASGTKPSPKEKQMIFNRRKDYIPETNSFSSSVPLATLDDEPTTSQGYTESLTTLNPGSLRSQCKDVQEASGANNALDDEEDDILQINVEKILQSQNKCNVTVVQKNHSVLDAAINSQDTNERAGEAKRKRQGENPEDNSKKPTRDKCSINDSNVEDEAEFINLDNRSMTNATRDTAVSNSARSYRARGKVFKKAHVIIPEKRIKFGLLQKLQTSKA